MGTYYDDRHASLNIASLNMVNIVKPLRLNYLRSLQPQIQQIVKEAREWELRKRMRRAVVWQLQMFPDQIIKLIVIIALPSMHVRAVLRVPVLTQQKRSRKKLRYA